jgi:hypothetical protein
MTIDVLSLVLVVDEGFNNCVVVDGACIVGVLGLSLIMQGQSNLLDECGLLLIGTSRTMKFDLDALLLRVK